MCHMFQGQESCAQAMFISTYVGSAREAKRVYVAKSYVSKALKFGRTRDCPHIVREMNRSVQRIKYVSPRIHYSGSARALAQVKPEQNAWRIPRNAPALSPMIYKFGRRDSKPVPSGNLSQN